MRIVRILLDLICFAYWALLTVLLLAPDPAAIVGLQHRPAFPWGEMGIHFTAFTVLAVLVHATRWPRPAGWLLYAMLLYAVATESLQTLVPTRTVRLVDYIENILGIAAGTAIYWTVVWMVRGRAVKAESAHEVLRWIVSSYERSG